MNRKIIWVLALVASVTCSQVIFANSSTTKASKPCSCKLFKKLDLTPEQQTQINAIRDQASVLRAAKKKELVVVDHQIQELGKADKLDEAKLETLLSQKKEIMSSLIKNKIMVKQQVYNILTAQQKAKYDEMVKGWEKNRKQ